MPSSSFATALVAVGTVILICVLYNRRQSKLKSKAELPLPPGPPPKWFWGHTMPTVNISSTFNDWADQYGPVITLRRGGEIEIVIARVDAATEIMEKQGSALADRPRMIAAGELLSGDNRMSMVGAGERFRRLRKALHGHFQPKAIDIYYRDVQAGHARSLVLHVLDDPKEHQKHAHRYSTSIIIQILYGWSTSMSIDDPEFVDVQQVIAHCIEGMRPDAYLVDRFPWLKYLPGYGMRLKKFYEYDRQFYGGQLDRVQRAISSNEAPSCFARTLLENVESHQLSYDEMSFLAGEMFETGSVTTAGALIVMIMAAACFPDAQLRVQEELDKVVGMDRLPSWNDWDDLPQVHAFISEVLRWRPVTPLGFAHRSTRDIIWRGYRIPAGTSIKGNLWAISRDPDVFPNPERFDPQRWLDQSGKLRTDLECYPFGFGRRVCPAQHLANRSMFIGLALVLWSFRIVGRPEAPIDTTPDMDNLLADLRPFEADFVPRMDEAWLREMMEM